MRERRHNALARELSTFDKKIISFFFKRDNYFLTMRFKCRFYNFLEQGLSGKNEQHVRPPWRGASRGARHNAAASDASA